MGTISMQSRASDALGALGAFGAFGAFDGSRRRTQQGKVIVG